MKPRRVTESQTIDYIRSITGQLLADSPCPSLALSQSEPSSITIHLATPPATVKKEKYAKQYSSPYRQHNMSIERIASTKRSPKPRPSPFTLAQAAAEEEQRKKSKPKVRSSSLKMKYLEPKGIRPSPYQRNKQKMKEEARLLHEKERKSKQRELTPKQRDQAWADFLLRERKWQEQRKNRIVQQRIEKKVKEDERPLIHSRDARPLSKQQQIRKNHRERWKLEQRLLRFEPNQSKFMKESLSRSPTKPNYPPPRRPQTSKTPERAKANAPPDATPPRIRLSLKQSEFLAALRSL